MKHYNFDEIIERRGTDCVKYDMLEDYFGNSEALPLWVADTDFRVPDFIMNALNERMNHEILAYSYRPESYYKAIINWMDRKHGWKINKEMITSSPGVVSGVTMLIMALSEPGDKVIVQPPVYFPFFTSIKGSGRKMVENPLMIKDGRYTFDFENLLQIIDSQTRLLILCSPHNPGGMVWTREELEDLSRICTDNGIVIISDEIHADLVFTGNKHIPIPMVSEKVAMNSAVLMAASKTFNVAGLSTAFVIIPNKKLRVKYERVLHTVHIDSGNIFGNIATEAALHDGHDWLSQLMIYLEDNYNFLETFITQRMPKIKIMKPEATFLVWLDLTAYNLSEKELAKRLIEGGIAINKGSIFGTGGEGYFRLNIGCPRAVLEEGLIKIEKALRNV
ncbi:MAG: PatB family C-S lyase [Bacteroidia bacterium]|nr:PatB family C-S lyase [Bacteroidia bacterium]